MTKLNYTNRKSEGLKLGQIVAKDLRKRAKPSSGAKSELHRDLSPIDLNLAGRKITDEGLAEAARGLEDALIPSDSGIPQRLQVLHLSNNGLTVRSLAELATSVEAAAHDLEDLDISHNLICISNEWEAECWEKFLRSLARCRSLKKLVLSDNDFSGAKAMEVLTKVYFAQFKINARSWEHSRSSSGGDEDGDEAEEGLVAGVTALSVRDTNIPVAKDSGLKEQSVPSPSSLAMGLPSIQYVGLSNCHIQDAGALFLSYVVERHRWIQSTLCNRTWGIPQEGHTMIVVMPNEALSPAGVKIMKLAEATPYHPYDVLRLGTEGPLLSRGVSESPVGDRRISGASSHQRRVSSNVPSNESTPRVNQHHLQTSTQELESLRKKIQRTIIENEGVHSVGLWKTALKLLTYVRPILMEYRYPINFPPLHPSQSNSNVSPTRELDGARTTQITPPTYASKLLFDRAGTSPGLYITGEASRAVTPHVFKHPFARKPQDSGSAQSRQGSSHVSSGVSVPPLKGAVNMDNAEPKIAGGLPIRAWSIIFAMLADPKGILSERKLRAVVAHGSDRKTLAMETDVLGKPESVQIWKVLEAVGCLIYDDQS